MPRYKWQGADVFRDNRNDREIEPGEVVELDEHVAGPHPQFSEVEVEADEGDETAGEEPEGTPDESEAEDLDAPVDPAAHSVPELEDALADGDFSDAELDAIEEAERTDGSPRTTALDAIDAHRGA
jgi:hypothetical protein